MLQEIPVEKIFKQAKSNGADFVEIFSEETVSLAISHENKRLEKISRGVDYGFGLRIIKNENVRYGFTNDPNLLIDVANEILTAPSPRPTTTTLSPTLSHQGRGRRGNLSSHGEGNKKVPQQLAVDHLIETRIVNSAAEKAWSTGKEIRQVFVNWRHSIRKIDIINSNGADSKDTKKDIILFAMIIAEKSGLIETGIELAGGTVDIGYFQNGLAEKIADTAAKRAVMMLSARPAPRGVMPIVISSSAGGTMIHEAVGHGLEADLAGQNMSVFSNKIGKKAASNIVTVIDDATMSGKRGTFNFDDEGTKAQRTVLIENGILKGYLHSLATAKKMGAKPTGNGRRENYRHRPIPRMTNTIIAQGKDNPDEIIKSVRRGLLIKRMGGGQVNTINGDFVFEAQEAYLIENGCAGEPVRGAALIGSGPKVLMDIDMVGSDIGFGLGTCGKDGQGVPVGHGMPTIRIPSITVGGTN